jgi:hypothetical protein
MPIGIKEVNRLENAVCDSEVVIIRKSGCQHVALLYDSREASALARSI